MINTLNLKVNLPESKIIDFCCRWKISELAVFGSVLRDDFRPDSDLDFLVTFAPDEHWSLFDLVDMKQELKAIVGREVDLIEKVAIERSHNELRRQEILSTAQTFYAAR